MFNFNFDMTPTYQMEYEFGMIDRGTLRTYVEMGILSRTGYKTILGEDYDESTGGNNDAENSGAVPQG